MEELVEDVVVVDTVEGEWYLECLRMRGIFSDWGFVI